jgi:creatinine amidohydrolase
MRWEELSAPQFEEAKNKTGVCVLPLGVLEKHGDHMPLGTDTMLAHELATRASLIEPAVVFPPFYFGQIYEARCFPGTIAIEPTLLIELLQNVLDEIARNGFKKIVVTNQHGGNESMLRFLAMCQLSKQRDYNVYFYTQTSEARTAFIKSHMETNILGHACECETSRLLYYRPDLVDLSKTSGLIEPLNRLDHVPYLHTGLWWYARVPNHVIGDPSKATKEKGQAIEEMEAKMLSEFIRAVKDDQVLPALSQEFHKKTKF